MNEQHIRYSLADHSQLGTVKTKIFFMLDSYIFCITVHE